MRGNADWQRIPTHDILGRKVHIGEKAIMFSRHGITYEGFVIQIGGKRWFQPDPLTRIGGIGNHFMIKDTGSDQDGRM
ncbi:hypothetical protein FQ087_18415 [Sporosarcina sp. ANT_H38]|uniref:hypothetical protein n=1 Tax=Sporosarcina sp. ANT_H38 TaxID=2597358 RepID=UPI0011F0C12B|nr:hypothetical protein [Sporosarcina sp. ANT_H38]KAA0944100.1 hypothetical protein FQ087_18415 [Sporosarcina sp. ANT_H38]